MCAWCDPIRVAVTGVYLVWLHGECLNDIHYLWPPCECERVVS